MPVANSVRVLPAVLAAALCVAACAPSTLPPPEGSPNSTSPTTGGPLSGTPEPELARTDRPDPQSADTRRYDCSTGTSITVRYPDYQTADVDYQGSTHAMHIALATNGTRYVGDRYEWWTQGSGPRATGTLYAHTADNGTGRQIASCQAAN